MPSTKRSPGAAERMAQASADPEEHLRERIEPAEWAKGPHDEADVPKRTK